MSEIVNDHATGLHFNPSDPEDLAKKVEWAWNHPAELASMGRMARRKYETDYTAEKNYSQLMEIYEQAIASCATPSLATTGARQIPLAARASQSKQEREF